MLVALLASLSVLAGACTGGDSTVSKTPTNTITSPPSSPGQAGASGKPKPPPSPTDDCAVNLKDPAVAAAIALLPPAPNSEATWNPVPVAGNYNKCAALSAIIVTNSSGATHTTDSATRAVFFHQGGVIAHGVPDTYGYNAIDLSASTLDTVVLNFSNGIPGLESVVSFRWNGSGVEKVQQAGQ
ncbi:MULTISPECIES: LppP/LprE family lipoprotein [unclassified Mycobacteroides]|uniref:LppP/LprE family lipoprotein n=1 Tax=unclassified Mycobacteroides TaxID=2618759 RepID=UPI001396CCBC|nr:MULTISPECIES: LppP/LprE family lipoprotein [unclassified Mycobacteroides]